MVQKHIKHKQILKTLKRDELREMIDKLVLFGRTNTENLLISIIILVVLIILIPMYFRHQSENEMRASNLFDRALSISLQPVQGENGMMPGQGFKNFEEKYRKTLEAYQEVSTTYRNTKVAVLARLGEATSWFYLKDYAKAAAIYQEELTKHTADYYTPVMKAHLGACQENTQKWAEAAQTYQEVLTQFSTYYDRRGVRLGLARCQVKLGKVEDAKKILNEEQGSEPGSYWSEMVRQQLALLKP
jgi:predicted negative regulator of RcsB-dependent stress response